MCGLPAHGEAKAFTTEAEPLLSPVFVQVCSMIAERHGLEAMTLNTAYQFFFDFCMERKLENMEDTLAATFSMHEQAIRTALESKKYPDDELNAELVVTYMNLKQDSVRGFVFDGFPVTTNQVKLLRNCLDGYDYEAVRESLTRQKSMLMDDPLDNEPPVLPRCLFDLVVFLDVDEYTSFQRIRELEYRDQVKSITRVPEVEETTFDEQLFVSVEKQLLQLYENMLFPSVRILFCTSSTRLHYRNQKARKSPDHQHLEISLQNKTKQASYET